MKRWRLSEVQVEAILNMRLRALRRLEEIAIRKELKSSPPSRRSSRALLERREAAMEGDRRRDRRHRARNSAARRSASAAPRSAPPPAALEVPVEALVEREPVTVLCSAKGWIRAVKGHEPRARRHQVQGRRRGRASRSPAATTDKLLVFATNGRFYTLAVDKLPGGRGHGEPLRLMIDLANEHDVVAMLRLCAPARSCWSRPATGAASSCRPTRSGRRRATASRC